MNDKKMGLLESRFADLVWGNEPLATSELVKQCEKAFSWKRTTTYTVLKRLSERGLFQNDNGTVTSLVSRQDFYAAQSERFVQESFGGSLPAFLAAFTTRKDLSAEEIAEIRAIIDPCGEE